MAASPAPPATPQSADATGALLLPAATAQLALAAWQRSIALQAEWFEESLRRARNHRELPTVQRPLTDWTEPALHYAIGCLALARSTQDQWVCLTSASLRGARGEVLRLAGDARDQASVASHEAGAATQSAWSCWLQGLNLGNSQAPGASQSGQRANNGRTRSMSGSARTRAASVSPHETRRAMTSPN